MLSKYFDFILSDILNFNQGFSKKKKIIYTHVTQVYHNIVLPIISLNYIQVVSLIKLLIFFIFSNYLCFWFK